jgi:hypothetical protein
MGVAAPLYYSAKMVRALFDDGYPVLSYPALARSRTTLHLIACSTLRKALPSD